MLADKSKRYIAQALNSIRKTIMLAEFTEC